MIVGNNCMSTGITEFKLFLWLMAKNNSISHDSGSLVYYSATSENTLASKIILIKEQENITRLDSSIKPTECFFIGLFYIN